MNQLDLIEEKIVRKKLELDSSTHQLRNSVVQSFQWKQLLHKRWVMIALSSFVFLVFRSLFWKILRFLIGRILPFGKRS